MRLVDADWVAERLKEWRNWIAETYGENDDYVLCLDTVLMKLDDAPTADVEPMKHGHWELSPFDGNWTCSKCGNKPYHYNMKNMNYCPNCGAKMDAEGENDV